MFGMRCMSPDISLGYGDVEKIGQGDIFSKYCKFVAQKVVSENKCYVFCSPGLRGHSELNQQKVGKCGLWALPS